MSRRSRWTVGRLTIVVAIVGLALAGERWISQRHPRAIQRRRLAEMHGQSAATWRSVPANLRPPRSPGYSAPRYAMVTTLPTGALANPKVYDVTARPWEYGDGAYYHRWLGPADPDRSTTEIQDDFFSLCLAKAAYHDRMAAKWSWATRLPWLPITPDPPGPPLVYDPPGDSW